jgi:hypothetical protein
LEDGTWSYTWDTAGKSTGEYKFSVRGLDEAGNIGRAQGYFEIFEEEIDRNAPEIILQQPTFGESLSIGTKVLIRGIARDDVGITSLKINFDYQGWLDITNTISGESFTYVWDTSTTHPQQLHGEHVISIEAYDDAGNSEDIIHIITLVDVVPPTINIRSPDDDDEIVQGTELEITGGVYDDVGISEIEITITGPSDKITIRKGIKITMDEWRYVWLIPGNQQPGGYTISATASDIYGNTETVSISFTIVGKKTTEKDDGFLGLPGFDGAIFIIALLSVAFLFRLYTFKK